MSDQPNFLSLKRTHRSYFDSVRHFISLRILVKNESDYYSGQFFRTRKVTFCSFVQQLDELRRFKTLTLRTSPKRKETNPTSTTSKTHFGYLVFFTFFGNMRLFSNFFGLHQRGPPSVVSKFRNRMNAKESQRLTPCTFFSTVTPFKNLIIKFPSKFFSKSPKGPSFIFFHILQPTGVSQGPEGPFDNFEP